MRILHILDHSIPLHSGYTFRTLSILKQQRALGWETFHLTSPKQGAYSAAEETVDGEWRFFRTPQKHWMNRIPVLNQLAVIANLTQRLEQLGWMLFLKIFDDREKELELVQDNYRSPLPKALRWRVWWIA